MCGIAGVLGHPDAAVLQRMNRLQQHRGPDENDVWHDEHVGFAHARLSILDLQSSQQPMTGVEGAVVILNGEIYNHRDLRAKHSGYPFQTAGDTEAVLAVHHAARQRATGDLSAKDHAAWLSTLDGMYAIALWHPASRELILARDPMGIKPLSRTMVDDSLMFASEVKRLPSGRALRSRVGRIGDGCSFGVGISTRRNDPSQGRSPGPARHR